MLPTEYDEAEVMELFRLEGERAGIKKGERSGFKKGVKKGEAKMAALINKLLSLGRIDDVQKASTDASYRNKLYKEFKLNK